MQSGQTVWARVSRHLGAAQTDGRTSKVHSDVKTPVFGVPVDGEATEREGHAMADNVDLAGSQIL